MASFPNSDDPSSYDPSMNASGYPGADDPNGAPGGPGQQPGGPPGQQSPDSRRAGGDATGRPDPNQPPPGHYPVHPSFLQPPPGYPAYGDPNARRVPGYPPDARDHMPPPGMMPMYPGYPPTMAHHGWPPMDIYGRPQPPLPPPDYRGDPSGRGMMRVPGGSGAYPPTRRYYEEYASGAPTGEREGKSRDSGMGMDDGMGEKEGKKPQKKTEVACDFCRTRKLKCDGTRPQCGQCSQRDQTCHYQTGPPNRRGPGRKNRMGSAGDSPGGSGPVSPRQRASKRKGTMEGLVLDLGDPSRRPEMGPMSGPPPPGVMGVMGPPPPGYMPYPPPQPGPPQ